MQFGKSPFLVYTCPHNPAAAAATTAAAPANADHLQEQAGCQRWGQRLYDDSQWNRLLHPAKGNRGEGELLCTRWWVWTSSCGTWYGSRVLTLPVIDIKVLNKVLHHFLEPGERVEANKGYRGHPDKKSAQGTTRIRRRIGRCRGG